MSEPVAMRAAALEAWKLIEEYPNKVNAGVLRHGVHGLLADRGVRSFLPVLRAFYEYEPAWFDSRQAWARFSARVAFNRAGKRQTPVDCPLPGIVPER